MVVMRKVSIAIALVLMGGCYEGVDAVGGDDEFRTFNPNTFRLNEFRLNEFRLNHFRLNEFRLNEFRLNEFRLNEFRLNEFRLNGSSFEGVELVNGEEVFRSGMDLIGGEFEMSGTIEGEDEDDLEVTYIIRIDDIYPDTESGYDDILLYDLSYNILGDDEEEWQSPCVDDMGLPVPATALSNSWDDETGDRIDDPDVVTFACTNGVIAHCVQWGYRPWAEADDCKKKNKKGKWKKCKDVSLRDHHQACTRMARADYCGDGEPWTVSGTAIDIWDNLSPSINAREADWEIEAEWTPDGAWCLNDIRQQGWKEEGLYPSCSKKMDKKWKQRAKKCGKLKKKSSLLVSSFNLDGE